MDEPLANLDPPHQTDWLLMVRELVASGKTVVSVLHEISFALQADELVVMDHGRITHQGACSDAGHPPRARRRVRSPHCRAPACRTVDRPAKNLTIKKKHHAN